MRVAVTGATGYVGQFVLADLLAQSHEIVAWCRPEQRTILPEGVAILPGRLDQPESFEALLKGADALVHAAFQHEPGRYRGGEGDDPFGFLEVNFQGSMKLLETARRLGVARCVLLSSRAVYDGNRDVEGGLDETVQPRPTTIYGAHKLALEAFVSAWGKGGGWHIAALRPTGIYGLIEPFERSKWVDLALATMTGSMLTPNRVATEVHGRDVAQAIRLLLSKDEARGEVYNCSDIIVSTDRLTRLLRGDGDEPLKEKPKRVMRTDKLQAIGWQPGGESRLKATLAAMVNKLSKRPSPDHPCHGAR